MYASTIMASANKKKKNKNEKQCDQWEKISMERIYQLDEYNTLLTELLTYHLFPITQAVLPRFS